MMNDQFLRSYMNKQPSRPVSVQQTHRKPSPKVVTVPVHFVSSNQPQTTVSMLKESAAMKIQRVFRGFLVRKSVKKIASIGKEVGEIERRINDNAVVDLMRRDAMERLRVNETLMALLFKLDSIRGVDCGVRDLRKAVTKKAIALQEKVDSMVQTDQSTLDSFNNGEIDSDTSERVPENSDPRDEAVDRSAKLESVENEGEIVVKEIVENCNPVEDADHQTLDSSNNGEIESEMEQVPKTSDSRDEVAHRSADFEAEETVVKEVVRELGNNCNPVEDADGKEDHMEVQKSDEGRNRELLEKLMDDNEKMMKLMMQIFERNELQTRMINSLSRRVEQLEKSFMCTDNKLRRKKKRHSA